MKSLVLMLSISIIVCFGYSQHTHIYLDSTLDVFYVNDLNKKDETAVTIPSGNQAHTFSSSSDNSGLYALLDKLYRSAQNGGDTILQASAKGILSITNKKVVLVMYNDIAKMRESNNATSPRGAIPMFPRWSNYCFCPKDESDPIFKFSSWPCANHYSQMFGDYTGVIGIGNFFLHSFEDDKLGKLHEKRHFYGTFIHELTHTQFELILEQSLGNLNMYGDDGNHYVNELIPSRNSAFNEAIANAFANFYIKSITWWTEVNKNKFHQYKFPEPITWLNNNDMLFTDVNAGCTNPNPGLLRHCLANRLASMNIASQKSMLGQTAIKKYPIRNLPPGILLHNEMIQTAIFEEYMRLFNSKELMIQAIKRVLQRVSAYPNLNQDMFGMVFKEMVRSAQTYKNPSGDSNTGKYLPLAILDFYTGFKIKDKETLARVTGQSWDDKDLKIDFYFESLRPNRLIKMWQEYSQKTNGNANNPAWNESILEQFASFLNVVPNKRVGEFPVR